MIKKKTYNYFEKFVELVDYSCKCADMLNKTLINFDTDTLEKKVKEIHCIEHAGDLAKHDMMEHLVKEFITPLEREDIVNISQQIDDITDTIEDVLMKIHMFNVTSIKPEALEFTVLISKSCYGLKDAIQELSNFKKSSILNDKIIEVNNLEEDGDRLYYNTIRNLYTNSTDAVELLVWTEIYNLLEKCCDACEITADTIETVVMKNL